MGQMSTQRFGLHYALTWRVKRVDVPKQEILRQGFRDAVERRGDEIDVVLTAGATEHARCGPSETPRLYPQRAPSAKSCDVQVSEAC